MIRTTQDLLLELSDYGTPQTKIQRMVKNGSLVKIRRGLYETDPNVPAYLLAGVICSPSYISFSYWKREGDYSYLIASPEKTLCDMLYIKPPAGSLGALKEMLFSDLRIDESAFANLNKEKLLSLTDRFHTQNIKLLARLVEKGLTMP